MSRTEPALPEDTRSLADALHDRLSRLSRQLRSIELPQGMTQERMSVMAIVQARQPISISALASCERVRPATMSRMVSSLEADGYVERLSDASDGRGVLVVATASGRRAFTHARSQRLARFSDALNTLPNERLDAMGELARALDELASIMDRPGN
jgi:DNA-binding MarR family transcriptional regulator